MPISARNLINSTFGIGLALWIGRTMPDKTGKRIARGIADWLAARRSWGMVRAVRANRWVISGETLQGAELDQAVRATFRHTAHSLFTLYHNFQNLEAAIRLVDIDPLTQEILNRPKYDSRGLVVVGLHMGNFDLLVQGSGLFGWQAMFMTLPEVTGGYKTQYDIRRKSGMNLVPASKSGFREAIEHLRKGGLVVTGMDRPEKGLNYQPMFFNRPAALPAHYVMIALRAQVPVKVGCSRLGSDGKYHVTFSEPIEMQPYPDRRQEMQNNCEAVLRVAENYIRQTPEQWEMTFPVWPDALDQVPVN